MSDDTRDIAIETRTEVQNLKRTVVDMDSKLDELIKRSNQQEGMAYAGRAIVVGLGAAGGAAVTFLAKLIPFSNTLPR